MTDEFVLHFEHARNLFDESDMIALPEPDQAQQLALTGIGRALLAVAGELRRLNEGRDQFHREVLGVLAAAKDPSGSLRSEQPAAASARCSVCGRPDGCDYPQTGLTLEQWTRHWGANFDESRSFNATQDGASDYADRETKKRFGPCPEES